MSDQKQKQELKEKFFASYNQLNKEQKKAVDIFAKTGGPIMVMAGPGTGKTQVIATTIANILDKQDVGAGNILALTFTDAAAQNMRERVVSMMGAEGFYVNIITFHSFASEVLAHYPEKFPIEKGSEPLSDFEKFEIFESIILSSKLEKLKTPNTPLYYIKQIISQISQLKREYITPEKFEGILDSDELSLKQDIEDYWQKQKEKTAKGKKAKTKLSGKLLKQQKNLAKQKELHLLYVKYKKELSKRKRYDYDDMISYVVDAFETDDELLLDYQERFHYVLVDEYQDTNAAQNKIVELLVSYWKDSPNVFVVGDPHQSIFRFQGASTENMLKFVNTYPNATTITLDKGYRCTTQVYDAAHQLITKNSLSFNHQEMDELLNKKLVSFQGSGADLEVFAADSQTLELLFLAEEIKALHKNGVKFEEISVLYRNNKEADLIQEILEKWEIPYEISIGGSVFDDLLISQLLSFFRVIQDLGRGVENEDLFSVMQYDWLGLDSLSVYKLARIAGKLRMTISEVLEYDFEIISKKTNDHIYGLEGESFSKLVDFKNKLLSWYKLSNNLLFHEWFSLIINADNSEISGQKEAPKPGGFSFMDYILKQPIKIDHLNAINSLYSEIKRFVFKKRDFSLDDFIRTVSIMQEHGVSIPIEDLNISKNRVSLSTAHSSKGKEWSYVFVFGCSDKKWGNARIRDLIPLPDSILTNTDITKKEKNEDDRRLFYVALTRSSKKTYVTWSKSKLDGKQMMNSMFINELGDGVKPTAEKKSRALMDRADDLLEKILTLSGDETVSYTKSEREFFKKLVGEFKLSVTALNTYLEDPHEFLINSLLRVPRAKSPILSFGTAVHTALEKFYFRLLAENLETGSQKFMTKDQFISSFEEALSREQLGQADFDVRKNHGQKVLSFYYENVLDPKKITHTAPLFVEKYFGGSMSKTILMDGETEIKLSGRIDRVELIDKEAKTVRVVDYKTGKPKTANVINGQTSIDDYSDREKALPETIRGRYQRQLVFYKLLAQLDRTFKYEVASTVFDFIEPGGTHQDKHVSHEFEISDQAVEDLKKLIKEVMVEIRELKFLE